MGGEYLSAPDNNNLQFGIYQNKFAAVASRYLHLIPRHPELLGPPCSLSCAEINMLDGEEIKKCNFQGNHLE